MAQADNSDEEDESRAGAIKKKARQDPFARTKGKKKKKGKAIPSNPVKVDGAGSIDSLVRPRVVKGDTPAATRDEEAVTPVAISTFTSSLSPKNQTATKPSGKSPSVPKICPEANPSPFPLNHLHKSKGPPTHPSGGDTCSYILASNANPISSDAVISPRNAKSLGSPSRSPKAYVAIPVLNLDGPPPQSESPPKKRRKKRKKKKSPVQRSDV